MTARAGGTKRINLALQGGGAHGAFTWGVLDRLLEESELEISGISGTSAGAMNGAALKAGLNSGGREAAREALDSVWQRIGATPDIRRTGWMAGWMTAASDPATISHAIETSPIFAWADAMSRLTSPYMLAPRFDHPLRDIVETFDFDCICGPMAPALYIGATNVRSGKIRIFTGDGITTDSILASGCLPTLFRAVEIDDPATGRREAYWDGGYMGNPALFPLFDKALPRDIVIININPLYRDEVPKTPQDIQNRINEISFNSSLFRELRAVRFVQDLIADGHLEDGALKSTYIHMIADDALMRELSVATKVVPVPAVLDALKEAGRVAASRFLEAHWDDLNRRQTVDLPEMFG